MKPVMSTELHAAAAGDRLPPAGDWTLLDEVCEAAVAAAAWVDADLDFRWVNSRFAEWFPHGLVKTGVADPCFKSGKGWEELARQTLSERQGQVDLLCQEAPIGGMAGGRTLRAY